ncbi:hypothetical protein INQ25_01085 [Wolbachia endosymbiont of Rhagoletis cerasi]|nr:hypothetical protein [Wolbachia endosymbiont of Rhagoletis cerasi]
MVRKDPNKKNRKFNINRKLLGKIFSALEGVDIQQSNFVSKINNQKDIKPGGTMPSPSRDGRENQINFEEGLDRIYGTKPASNQEDYPEGLSPFDSELQKRKLSARESEWLSWFKSAIVTANTPRKMLEVVNKAIDIGMKMNGCHGGSWSFAEYVILGTHFHKFKKGDLKKIIHELMRRGAEFHDRLLQNKLIGETYNELQPEVQPQIDKQLEERKKAGKNAVRGGSVIDVEIDNKTSLIKFSEGSTVEVAKALEGTDLNSGLGSNIIKIGSGEIEIRSEEGGKRNYTDVLGSFEITFPTSIGRLRIIVYHDAKNYDQVQVRALDREMLFELQAKGEEVAKNCLFGGMTVEEAVKRGSFTRSGFLGEKKATEEREAVSEALSSSLWIDRIRGGSQETFKQR